MVHRQQWLLAFFNETLITMNNISDNQWLDSAQLPGRFLPQVASKQKPENTYAKTPSQDSNSAITVTSPSVCICSGSRIIPRHSHNQEFHQELVTKHCLSFHRGKFCLKSTEQLSWSLSPLHLGFHHHEESRPCSNETIRQDPAHS